MTRSLVIALCCWQSLLMAASAVAQEVDTSRWDAYLDFAYVYVSADAEALRVRLQEYGNEAGMTLAEYVTLQNDERRSDESSFDEAKRRRLSIALLLRYLSIREPRLLDRAVEIVSEFDDEQGRHENLYWYHYIMAHRAMEKGNSAGFTRELLDLWLRVVVPLESSYETLQALSLSQSANSGFVSALPYVFENITRTILIRSQEMGIHHDLDPLASIVRLLAMNRVGSHLDVIPLAASSKDYLDRIMARLDGPESDGGSLTFTLVLFEAGKYHDQARSLLASEALSENTVKAIGVASGAYRTALNQAQTLQGQSAVYTRVLRQLGEVWAAKQRLGVDPYVETPFSIEDAIEIYRDLHASGREEGWQKLGFRRTGFESYMMAMQRLWEEIQEASLNAADYYVTRSIEEPSRADSHLRSAAGTYARYFSLFAEYAPEAGAEYVPDSAFFAAYECAKGYGDSFLAYSMKSPTHAEIALAVERYQLALGAFPFDRRVWSSLARALERQGRSNQYLSLARPIADAASRSRHVASWIQDQEKGSAEIEILRRAMSDELAVIYLGFAEGAEVAELEKSMADLRQRKADVDARLVALGAVTAGAAPPASIAYPAEEHEGGAGHGLSVVERAERGRNIAEARLLLEKLDKQIAARNRALPLFKATLKTDGLIQELRSQRDHPAHTLLRRLYYETHS